MNEMEKIINAYECVITNRSVCNCGKCDYHITDAKLLFCDSGKILRDVLALLKEQEAVVRCKDCKHNGMDSSSFPQYWCSAHSEYHDADWFCADAERKSD